MRGRGPNRRQSGVGQRRARAIDSHRIGLYLVLGGLLTLAGGLAVGSQMQPGRAAAPPDYVSVRDLPRPDVSQAVAVAIDPTTAPEPPAALVGPASILTDMPATAVTASAAILQPPPEAPLEAAPPAPTPTRVPAAPTATPVVVPPTATPRPPPPPAVTVSLNALESEMFTAHNVERGKAGLGGLRLDARLVDIARQRARDMAVNNYFSHTSPSGETVFTLMSKMGYSYALAGENIARNNYPESQAASTAMTGFMNSSGHRANILDGRFKLVGIGEVSGADGMKYFAVVFAGE